MNLEEAIKTAIEYETRVRDTYREAAKLSGDPIGQKVLGALGDEEQGHLDYLEEKLKQWTDTGAVTEDQLATAVPSPDEIRAGVDSFQDREAREGDTAEIELLARALELELETSEFYQKVVTEMPPDQQGMFRRFEEIEQGHVAIVQAELDNLRGLGFWFDYQEFDLESG